ncbi:MAG: RsmB/NOP family class I SAM-dependent RNA methyltransferase [Nanoarchaeota archaeon]|nr:RsmB/NOP family class I SAM-dependent RNA methyltransferase [Nanoarchaeota archaeon]
MPKFKRNYEPKPLFLERMKKLLPEEKDFQSYLESTKQSSLNSIRCNTLKITPKELKQRLEEKGWQMNQPFQDYPEIMIIEGKQVDDKGDISIDNNPNKFTSKTNSNLIPLGPGEIGRSLEHQLGYYYVQDISSMLPIIALSPEPNETILDLCASPGSKTTQTASSMKNSGLIIANDNKLGRISILSANLERCGVTNAIIAKNDAVQLCKRLKERGFLFDKILLDAPCSSEGTIKNNPATLLMWNPKTIENLSKIQKVFLDSAMEVLKPEGILVYSTCTHAPEENEEVVDFALKNFKIKIESIKLPVKCRQGVTKWNNKKYDKQVIKSCRIYPQDTGSEGFFIAKLKKLS